MIPVTALHCMGQQWKDRTVQAEGSGTREGGGRCMGTGEGQVR